MKRLNPKILEFLKKRTGCTLGTLRVRISEIKQKNTHITSNGAAQIIALKNNTSVLRMLDKEDRESLPLITNIQQQAIKKGSARKDNNKKIIEIIKYETDDYFKKGHINELNKAYSMGCYTTSFILARKIIENLIIDILKKKFPSKRELYWNKDKSRFEDFSVILENIYKMRNNFADKKEVIERLNQLVKPFKKDTNNKTHSWFHLVKNPREIDNLELDSIIELIKGLEAYVGIK